MQQRRGKVEKRRRVSLRFRVALYLTLFLFDFWLAVCDAESAALAAIRESTVGDLRDYKERGHANKSGDCSRTTPLAAARQRFGFVVLCFIVIVERDSNGGFVRFIRFDGHQRFLRKSIFSSIDDDIYGTKVTPTDVVREKRPVIAGSWIYVRTSVLRGGHLGRALDGFVPHVSNLNRDVNAASVTSLQV